MKKIRSIKFIDLGILRLPMLLMLVLCCVSCSTDKKLPEELKSSRILYKKVNEHSVGPAGLDKSFYVYEISEKFANKVASGNIGYLNSLASSKKADEEKKELYQRIQNNNVKRLYWVGYSDWRITPVSKNKEWTRGAWPWAKDWKPSISTFLSYPKKGKPRHDDFISAIPPAIIDSFHNAISIPGNVYAYGGLWGKCVLVIEPSQRRAYYLYRN